MSHIAEAEIYDDQEFVIPALKRFNLCKFRSVKKPRCFAAEEQMGPARLLCANNTGSRIFKFSQPFYSIFNQRRQQIIFGERPEDLQNAQAIDKRIWEKHQTYLKRAENFPLKKAAYYRNLQESTGVKSVRALSEITGEDWSYIARVLKTLELPEYIQKFLKENQQPEILECFNLRRLVELVRIPDEHRKLMRFRELLDEANAHSNKSLTEIPQIN